jgi:hypothetical protein
VVFILAGLAFVVGVAVLIGSALTALPFIWGTVVAFTPTVVAAAGQEGMWKKKGPGNTRPLLSFRWKSG